LQLCFYPDGFRRISRSKSSSQTDDLVEEAEALKAGNAPAALNQVEQALANAIANKDVFNEGRCYLLLGEINANIQEWRLALGNFNNAYQILSQRYQKSKELQRVIRGLSISHLELGNLELSLDFARQALEGSLVTKERNDLQLHLSEIYYRMDRYEDALTELDKIVTRKKIADPSLESRIESQRAKIYVQLKDYARSQASYQNSVISQSKGGADQQDVNSSLSRNKEEISEVLKEQKRYDDEINLRAQSITSNIRLDNLAEVAKDKVAISKSLEAKGENVEALREVEEAAAIAEKLDNPVEQVRAFRALAESYDKNGRSNDAIKAYRKYSEAVLKKDALTDSLSNTREQIIKKQNDIEAVTKKLEIADREETISNQTIFTQKVVIYGLIFIIAIVLVTSWFIYRGAQASKTANQLLALKSLRSQMNPHFIFNALNSVNHFVAQQDERTANKFLSEFSLLMRLVLENSQQDFIPLQKEQEILSLYLKLEHYRFRDKFDYIINIDPSINLEATEIPPMLIQPYIENAVWHGLRYKEQRGHLTLSFQKADNDVVVVEITDDGIGRERSAALKTPNQKKHNSTGLKNIDERLRILNKVHKANYRVLTEH
jgi:tetratricopeptide (TPR) repeat protein